MMNLDIAGQRVIGYVRVSDPRQGGLTQQLYLLKKFVAVQRAVLLSVDTLIPAPSATLDDVCYDEYTGTEMRRDGLTKLLGVMASTRSDGSRLVDGMVLPNVGRLGRERSITRVVCEIIWLGGGRVFVADGGGRELVPEYVLDAHGAFRQGLDELLAELDRRVQVERMDGGRQEAIRDGRFVGSGLRYGWRSQNGVLVEDPFQQQVLASIRSWREDYGLPYEDIAARLNDNNVPTGRMRNGRPCEWHAGTLRRMMNPEQREQQVVRMRRRRKRAVKLKDARKIERLGGLTDMSAEQIAQSIVAHVALTTRKEIA